MVCPANRSSGSDVNPVQSVKVLANPVAATVANNPEGSDCNDVHPSNVLVKVKFPVAEKVANRSSGSVRSEEHVYTEFEVRLPQIKPPHSEQESEETPRLQPPTQ